NKLQGFLILGTAQNLGSTVHKVNSTALYQRDLPLQTWISNLRYGSQSHQYGSIFGFHTVLNNIFYFWVRLKGLLLTGINTNFGLGYGSKSFHF
ncbi:hypothetical protein D6V26_06315, partial [Vibrio cholerae]|nr:hypothetical protein [Vibrio cholerae]